VKPFFPSTFREFQKDRKWLKHTIIFRACCPEDTSWHWRSSFSISLITLLLWIYYAAQILLFGAEFTQVYANTYGTHVEPQEHAVKVQRTE
jgi:hypothetical protein